MMLRAVSSPLTTGAASALLRTVVADIIASIGPIGAGARLLQSCLVLSFDNGIGTVKVPGIAVNANKAAFIAEGAANPGQRSGRNCGDAGAAQAREHLHSHV
jgi:hypothetical protein